MINYIFIVSVVTRFIHQERFIGFKKYEKIFEKNEKIFEIIK